MFERFTEQARRSLFFARYEASQMGTMSIEPEHLLLGLLRLGPSTATPFLQRLPDHVQVEITERSGTGDRISTSTEIPFSKSAIHALESAARESDLLRHTHVGTEHLLLGLLADTTTFAGTLLSTHGVTAEGVRAQIAAQPPALDNLPITVARSQLQGVTIVVRHFGEQYARTDEARRLVDQICRDLETLSAMVMGEGTA